MRIRLHSRPVQLHLGRAGRALGRRGRARRLRDRLGLRPLLPACAPDPRSRRSKGGAPWRCCSPRPRACAAACMVTGMPYRHPAVLANMAVTVDIASGGRLELGLGAGWFEPECAAYGIELGSVPERFARFEEALRVIRSLLTQPTTTFDGRYYRLERRWWSRRRPSSRTRRSCWAARVSAGCSRWSPVRRPLELLGRDVAEFARLRPTTDWASCARTRAQRRRPSPCRPYFNCI